MGVEARWIVLVSAVLTAYGLAVLFSASALVAMNENRSSTFFLSRQLTGVVAGIVVFAIAAKFDAGRLERWAWPIMWFTIGTMAMVLFMPESIAPRLHGSKRFLVGASFQPSEFAKLGVIVWVSMLVVRKGP